MDAATLRLLHDGAESFGVVLGRDQVAKFEAYLALLNRWNGRINLTRIVGITDIVAKHFLDSLSIVPHLQHATSLVDVGSGAGFPGAVIAIARPAIQVTLVESVQKKAAFLEGLRRELGLSLMVRACRLEDISDSTFDVAVSRAALAPPEWIRKGAALVNLGGMVIAMLGKERLVLPQIAGFTPPELIHYRLPVDGDRALAILRRDPSAP